MAALAEEIFERQEEGGSHPVRTLMKDVESGTIVRIPIDLIEGDPDQPRKEFDPAALEELTNSIREHGVLQPIAVHEVARGERYRIIFGERRWRASKDAGLTEMPVLVRKSDDRRELALIENLQRQNLSALEEAEALLRLKDERHYTDEQLAKIIGKSRVAVTEALALTNLPTEIKTEAMSAGRQWSKSQLLHVIRAGEPEKVRATWEALKTGEVTTRAELRQRKEPPTKGRPKHYTFTYSPDEGGFRLSLTFSKSRVSSDEVKAALRAALKHVD